jgi:hypothetical protein
VAAVVLLIVLGVVALILGRGVSQQGAGLDRRTVVEDTMTRISKALVEYSSLNGRLPCPASGTLNTGDADPNSASATCNSLDGVVPWKTLGLRREDGLDGWGRKISYRVYSGTTGFTQSGGINMTDCNTQAGASNSVDSSGKCRTTPARNTPPSAFLAGKGLSVQTDSGTTSGYAFVLISHGETGIGAWGAESGMRTNLPNGQPISAAYLEYRNTQSGSTFDNRSRSAPGVTSIDTTYFDDVVHSVTVADLTSNAKLSGRDWGLSALNLSTSSSTTFSAANIAAALGFTPSTPNTGQSSVNFGAFTATSLANTAARYIASGTGTSGQGIGVITTTSTTQTSAMISSSSGSGETLRLTFTDPAARYLGITLVDFGIFSGTERVRFDFYSSGSLIASISKSACSSANSGLVLANFLLDSGGTFDRVDVVARSTTTGAASTFLVGGLRTCNAVLGSNTCTASGAVPANDCP